MAATRLRLGAADPAAAGTRRSGPSPYHFSRASRPRASPGPNRTSWFLTSDSRRWLRNASRPLGAADFPLPLSLPLPLAGRLPAPGAARSSMWLVRGSLLPPGALWPGRPRCRAPRAKPHPPRPYWLWLLDSAPPRSAIGCATTRSGTWRMWGLFQGISHSFYPPYFCSVVGNQRVLGGFPPCLSNTGL